MGRRPEGDRPLTPAEKQQRYRDKLKKSAELVSLGSPEAIAIQQCFQKAVDSQSKLRIETPSIHECENLYKLMMMWQSILGVTLKASVAKVENKRPYLNTLKYAKLFLRHIPEVKELLESETLYFKHGNRVGFYVPNGDKALKALEELDGAAKHLRSFIDRHDKAELRPFNWGVIAQSLAMSAKHAWSTVGHPPTSLNYDAPLCIFVAEVLEIFDIRKSPSAVSEVLRERRNS